MIGIKITHNAVMFNSVEDMQKQSYLYKYDMYGIKQPDLVNYIKNEVEKTARSMMYDETEKVAHYAVPRRVIIQFFDMCNHQFRTQSTMTDETNRFYDAHLNAAFWDDLYTLQQDITTGLIFEKTNFKESVYWSVWFQDIEFNP